MLLIPAIDLKDGLCVRLRQGRMEDDTVFSDDPVAVAEKWVNLGAKRLHMVDLNGAFEGKPVNADVVYRVCQRFPELTVQIGGGIRDADTLQTYLDAGVEYTIIGTKAVKEPVFVTEMCTRFPGHIIVGLDAKNGKVATDGWAEVSALEVIDLAQRFEHQGVSAIVYTDIVRDGMMSGVNIEATVALAEAISIPVIASGGITDLDDLKNLGETGCKSIIGAITGRAIYEGTLDFQAGQSLAAQYAEVAA